MYQLWTRLIIHSESTTFLQLCDKPGTRNPLLLRVANWGKSPPSQTGPRPTLFRHPLIYKEEAVGGTLRVAWVSIIPSLTSVHITRVRRSVKYE
jgi:hypothetical protein